MVTREPGKCSGLWNNNRAAAERNGFATPEHPFYLQKPETWIVGYDVQVVLPTPVGRMIFEGDLGPVIDRPCCNESPTAAEIGIVRLCLYQ